MGFKMKHEKITDISTPKNRVRMLRWMIFKNNIRLVGAYIRREFARAEVRYYEWKMKRIKGE